MTNKEWISKIVDQLVKLEGFAFASKQREKLMNRLEDYQTGKITHNEWQAICSNWDRFVADGLYRFDILPEQSKLKVKHIEVYIDPLDSREFEDISLLDEDDERELVFYSAGTKYTFTRARILGYSVDYEEEQ